MSFFVGCADCYLVNCMMSQENLLVASIELINTVTVVLSQPNVLSDFQLASVISEAFDGSELSFPRAFCMYWLSSNHVISNRGSWLECDVTGVKLVAVGTLPLRNVKVVVTANRAIAMK